MTDLAATTAPRRVLVTGASGLAGRHLIDLLLVETDWDIVAVTRAPDVVAVLARHSPRLSLVDRAETARLTWVWHDLRRPIPDDLVGEEPIDVIFNLASDARTGGSIDTPIPSMVDNLAIVGNILEWASHWVDGGLTHFIHVSSNEVYGPGLHGPWDPILPPTPYSAGKAAQEAAALAYWATFDVPIVLVNTMNLYGEGQDPAKMIPAVIRNLQNGNPVTVVAANHGTEIPGLGISGRVVDLDDDPFFDDPYHPTDPGLSGSSMVADPDGKLTVRDTVVDGVRYLRDANDQVWQPSTRSWLHAVDLADALRRIVEDFVPLRRAYSDRPTRLHVVGERVDAVTLVETIAAIVKAQPRVTYVEPRRAGHEVDYQLTVDDDWSWQPRLALSDRLRDLVTWAEDHPDWLV